MRSAIFVSLVFASGVTSFGASACDTRDVYNQKISGLMGKYQSEITKANDAFAHENMSVVKVVYTNGSDIFRENIFQVTFTRTQVPATKIGNLGGQP